MGYGYRTLEQNYECNLIKYNVKFIQNRFCRFLILPLFRDEILMLQILHQLCKELFSQVMQDAFYQFPCSCVVR